MISKTELSRVSKEIPGSGLSSGTRWALFDRYVLRPAELIAIYCYLVYLYFAFLSVSK